jgi:phosphoadenosine phosphosulfate reductase
MTRRTKDEIRAMAASVDGKAPSDVLALAMDTFEPIGLAFSGSDDVVLIDMCAKLGKLPQIFFLDTGRLHGETYRFVDKIRRHYDVAVEALFPDAARVEKLVREKGLFSFYDDGHQECCSIRKVGPLRRKLGSMSAWITGQRRDQNPDTRAHLSLLEEDTAFSTADNQLVKVNPLAAWSSRDVWAYIAEHSVPFNELHKRGFTSIGCEPCTRATLPNEPERAGRWWWEETKKKECGLHVINLERG